MKSGFGTQSALVNHNGTQPCRETDGVETQLSVENVSLRFGVRQVLRAINLKIDKPRRPGVPCGQVVALLGNSGIGKTQLLKLIAGLTIQGATVSGSVFVTPQRKKAAPGLVGMVMQDNPLRRNRTVIGNLTLAAKQRYNETQAQERSLELLHEFGLAEAARKYPAELSCGMRQRVAIIQQILCSEKYLLMDEPFAALDQKNLRRVCALIHKIVDQDEANTVILVTHDIRAALTIADKLYILGYERNEPGATITREVDLAAEGLRRLPDIYESKLLIDMEQQVRSYFYEMSV